MSTQKHTPGPWKTADGSTQGLYDMVIDLEQRIVARCAGDTDMEARANARLIAAAPALLEACKAALDGLYSYRDIPGNASAMAEKEKLEQAIKQAEGKV